MLYAKKLGSVVFGDREVFKGFEENHVSKSGGKPKGVVMHRMRGKDFSKE